MSRGQYKQYLRDPNVPIPESTLRDFNRREIARLANGHVEEEQCDDHNSQRSRSSLGQENENNSEDEDMPSAPASENDADDEDDEGGGESDSDHTDCDEWATASEGDGDNNRNNDSSSSSDESDPEDPEDPVIEDDGLEEDDREPIYHGREGQDCPITIEEGTLLILSFTMRFGLSDVALENLLRLLNCHMPRDAYGSLHTFKKRLPMPPLVERRYYCPAFKCRRPVIFQDNQNVVQCECQNECIKSELNKDYNYYLTLPLEPQLVSLLKDDTVYRQLRWQDRNSSDVVNGQFYRDLVQNEVIIEGRDITIQFNTDGAQIFKSSTKNIWPLQVMINELPFSVRKESIILCGMWYGSKPNMNTFLASFIEEMTNLQENGFHIPGDPPRFLKVHTLICSVDSAARPAMQGLKTWRGSYGCNFCLHAGEEYEVGDGSARMFRGDVQEARTQEQHLRDTVEYNKEPRALDFHLNGVHGTAALLTLPNFDIIQSFVPDYLHAVLLGVVKTMVDYWTSNSGQPFYIGNEGKINQIDHVLLSIKPPCEITRVPRTFHGRHLWRGHEWKNFLLYYSLPCLKAVNFPAKYLNHWFLLVYGISCFLRDKISEQNYANGTAALRQYVLSIEEIYHSAELMKFNTHLLLHFPKSVQDFGALWAWSTFKYESYNGLLGKMFKSSQSAPLQICKNYTRLQGLKDSTKRLSGRINTPRCVLKLLKEMGRRKTTRHVYVANPNFILMGVPEQRSLNVVELNEIQNLYPNDRIHNRHVHFHLRFIYRHVIFHGNDYRRLKKRNNSVVKSIDDQYVLISHAVRVRVGDRDKIVILGLNLEPTGDLLCADRNLRLYSSDFCTSVRRTDQCIALRPQEIERKCVLTFYPGEPHKLCCFPLVNLIERD